VGANSTVIGENNNTVVIGGNIAEHGTVIGKVVENVYVSYESGTKEAATAVPSSSLLLVTEDVRVTKDNKLILDFGFITAPEPPSKFMTFATALSRSHRTGARSRPRSPHAPGVNGHRIFPDCGLRIFPS
jgi:hypothetical protein